jgi:hypothetical protein
MLQNTKQTNHALTQSYKLALSKPEAQSRSSTKSHTPLRHTAHTIRQGHSLHSGIHMPKLRGLVVRQGIESSLSNVETCSSVIDAKDVDRVAVVRDLVADAALGGVPAATKTAVLVS